MIIIKYGDENDSEIINKTNHPVHLFVEGEDDEDTLITFPKCETPIRLEEYQRKMSGFFINGDWVDIKFKEYTPATLPVFKENVYYIVSALVATSFPNRTDFLMVNDTVRDETGRIIGCKSFAIAQP
tara:strand:- start:150 stop:530 length:381 start_codon:yes stop_codon:yes gene_type:complete